MVSAIRDASYDDHNDDSDVSMIDSDSDSSMDISASVLVPTQEDTSERDIKATWSSVSATTREPGSLDLFPRIPLHHLQGASKCHILGV